MAKVVIVVERGFVQEVFSTSQNVDVEVLDFDSDRMDEDEREELDEMYEKVSASKRYHCIY